MQFHPTGTLPPDDAAQVCRNSRFHILVVLLVFWAAPVVWYLAGVMWLVYACAALALLLTWPMLGSWAQRGRPENWVLALTSAGIWINFRDCEYAEVEPSDTALFVPYEEILSARKTVHRYKTPDSDGDVSHKDIYLDLQLVSPDVEQLRTALQAERQLSTPTKKYLGGFIGVSAGTIKRQPIDLIGNDLLRVKFVAGTFGLLPRLKKVLPVLANYVAIEGEEQQTSKDTEEMSDAEFADLVRKLVVEGRQMDATKMIRDRTGKSLAEARAFLEEVSRQVN